MPVVDNASREYVLSCLKRRPMSYTDLKNSHLDPHLVDPITSQLEEEGLIEKTSDGWRIVSDSHTD